MSLLGIVGKLVPRALRERIVLGQIRKQLARLGVPKDTIEGVIMKGWKTKAGGILAILSGLGAIVKEIADGSFNFQNIMAGITVIGGGLAALGIGHKVDKNTDAVETNTSVTAAKK